MRRNKNVHTMKEGDEEENVHQNDINTYEYTVAVYKHSCMRVRNGEIKKYV